MFQTYLLRPGFLARDFRRRAGEGQISPIYRGRSFGQNRPQDDSLRVKSLRGIPVFT